MTSMGRFAWLSETMDHPSVPTFVVALVGAPFTARDFERAWQRRDMSLRHARLDQCIGRGGGSSSSSAGTFVPTLQPLAHHVTETLFPSLYRIEVKDRLVSVLTSPYPVYDRLWNVQLSTGGAVGQSGVIPKAVAQSILTAFMGTHSVVPPPTESLMVFSAHHVLADGVSLSAAITDLCDEAPELQLLIEQEWSKRKSCQH